MKLPILFAFAGVMFAQSPALKSVNEQVKHVIDEISVERIAATMQKLESFGTRNPHSALDDPAHGTGAARAWIAEQFRSYSPRLEVWLDRHAVKKGGRFTRDLEIVNIVAVLPGTSQKNRRVLVTGHYDSMVMIRKKDAGKDASPAQVIDWEATANAPVAPGVSDDASGTALTMELARAMSQHEWEKTLVFITFDAEEEGLVGSTRFAEDAKKAGMIIDGVLNNDIIGNDVGGDGRKQSARVYLFSDDPADGPSRSLARYIKDMGVRYVPAMTIDLVYRADRFGRGGDHTPFNAAGYPAVRFTTETENYANQHTVTDTFANSSPAYVTNVARVNAATAACLASAPAAPEVTREATTGAMKGRRVPMIARGKSGYDAALKWSEPKEGGDVDGYVVTMRPTSAPLWQNEWYVGKVREFTLNDTSIDNVVFGVKAVDKDGNESPVSAYTLPARLVFEGSDSQTDSDKRR